MSNTRKSFLMGAISGVMVTAAAVLMVGMGQPTGVAFVTGDGHNAYLWSAQGGKLTFLDAAQVAKGHEGDDKGKKDEGEKGKDDGKGKGKDKGK